MHVVLEARDRIVLALPRVHLVHRPIGRAVIGRAVMTETIGHRFDEHRPRLSQCDLARRFGCVVHGEQVVAIDPDAHHAVAGASGRNSVASVLVFTMYND